jgi:hypothetical protein
VSARAEWGATASGPAFLPGAATAGGRPGSGGRGGRECACRARVVGVGVRAAAARAGCGVRAAWAGVEGCSLSLARSLSLSRSLARSLSLSLSLSPRTVRNGTRLRRSSLDKVGV